MSITRNEKVVVAILNNLADFEILKTQFWYRIPVSSATKWLNKHWPPEWLAFYHTRVFGNYAYGIHYYARVLEIRIAHRRSLFPDEPLGTRENREYYQIFLEPLRELSRPILSRRLRRIVFIPTTWIKFTTATEINDLYDGSPLEDRLWVEFKRIGIAAFRQEFIKIREDNYALDFAIYCHNGKIDVETDGDKWHANPERASTDNLRDNTLKTAGWDILRFTTRQVMEQTVDYTVPTVLKNLNRLGGVDEGNVIGRRFDLDRDDYLHQPSLFE